MGLRFGEQDKKLFGGMAGISLDAKVSCGGKEFAEEILVTHTGLSGPAILQISNYWQKGERIKIDWLGGIDVFERLMELKQVRGAARTKKLVCDLLPRRFAVRWVERYFCDKKLAECSRADILRFADAVNRWEFLAAGTEGFKKAEVTIGGVDTGELSSKTMECKKVEGLYFIGEVVDVAGELGGYNLQWAWSSGFAAGQVV